MGGRWGTVGSESVVGSAGWYLTARHIGRVPVFSSTWRALIAGLVMGVAVYPMSNLGGVMILIPIAAGVVVYAVPCLLLRLATTAEIALPPPPLLPPP